jgi:hypothetical protein
MIFNKTQSKATLETVRGAGEYVSRQGTVYALLLVAFSLLVASICVPYYTDSTGSSSGVYGSGKDCLGFLGMNCDVVHVMPVLTILFTGLTLLLMTSRVTFPFLSKRLPMRMKNIGKSIDGFAAAILPCFVLATVFAVVTLGTQLGMPLSGTSLADQAKNSSSTTTFKDGMALSSAGVALIIVMFLFYTEIVGKLGYGIGRKLGLVKG